MREDFIFHLVPEKIWKASKNNSMYDPESLQNEGYIHCSTGTQIQQVANRLYKGERKLLLLVINATLVEAEIKYEPDEATGEVYPHVYGPLNPDAIVDRIRLLPEDDGSFEISFTSD
jgi:uncharacterized protein (DUF952 family)